MSERRGLVFTVALAAVLAGAGGPGPSVALAQEATSARFTASLASARPGASTALTLSFALGAGEAALPPPLSRLVVHLPPGLRMRVAGVVACPLARLRRSGAGGCPAGSLVGRGHSVLEVHAGSQEIPENATLLAFRTAGGTSAFAILGQGETPLQRRTVSTASLSADSAPYGSKLSVTIPPIPTVMYEPDASTISMSVTLGSDAPARARGPRASVSVPRACPAGGFRFAADLLFAGGSATHASARVRCP